MKNLGRYPRHDGWHWVYRLYDAAVKPIGPLRRAIRGYLIPTRFEEVGNGRFYRLLGVHRFGRVLPTGGIDVRRLTRSRMAPYTLTGTSLGAASDFFFKTCVFEVLHLPFFLVLLGLSIHRLSSGRVDAALENLVVNLVVNVYPMMHHRYTRVRIVRLLRRRPARPQPGCETSRDWVDSRHGVTTGRS